MSSVGNWFDKELCWISGHSYQIIESSFSQKFYYASLRDRLKEGPQWVNCVVLITTWACWMRGKPLLQAYHHGMHDKVILLCWSGIIHSLPKVVHVGDTRPTWWSKGRPSIQCCNTVHSRSMCSIFRVWPQCWQAVGGPRDKIWDFVALEWLIRSRVITTSSALVRCRNLLGGPSVGFRRYRSLPCIDTSHLIWTSCWM